MATENMSLRDHLRRNLEANRQRLAAQEAEREAQRLERNREQRAAREESRRAELARAAEVTRRRQEIERNENILRAMGVGGPARSDIPYTAPQSSVERPWQTLEQQTIDAMRAAMQAEGVRPAAEQPNMQQLSEQEILTLEAQSKRDADTDPEVNRIALLFYSSLMTMIKFEFGYENPTWEALGWREKKAWLASAKVIVEELRKTPVAMGPLATRRIISEE